MVDWRENVYFGIFIDIFSVLCIWTERMPWDGQRGEWIGSGWIKTYIHNMPTQCMHM